MSPFLSIKPFLLLLGILFLSSCTRSQSAQLRISLPEATSAAELDLIRTALLTEQELLPDRLRFYHSILVSMMPEPSIEITYDPEHLGKQNLLFKLNDFGYSVEGRPGDPVKRLSFLTRTLSP